MRVNLCKYTINENINKAENKNDDMFNMKISKKIVVVSIDNQVLSEQQQQQQQHNKMDISISGNTVLSDSSSFSNDTIDSHLSSACAAVKVVERNNELPVTVTGENNDKTKQAQELFSFTDYILASRTDKNREKEILMKRQQWESVIELMYVTALDISIDSFTRKYDDNLKPRKTSNDENLAIDINNENNNNDNDNDNKRRLDLYFIKKKHGFNSIIKFCVDHDERTTGDNSDDDMSIRSTWTRWTNNNNFDDDDMSIRSAWTTTDTFRNSSYFYEGSYFYEAGDQEHQDKLNGLSFSCHGDSASSRNRTREFDVAIPLNLKNKSQGNNPNEVGDQEHQNKLSGLSFSCRGDSVSSRNHTREFDVATPLNLKSEPQEGNRNRRWRRRLRNARSSVWQRKQNSFKLISSVYNRGKGMVVSTKD